MQTNASVSSVSEHLASRHVRKENYSVYVDEEERVATFLLWNLSGQLVGFQQYRPDSDDKSTTTRKSRYFPFFPGGRGVFGIETMSYSREIFLVEGIFDAVRLHNEGKTAIAVLCNDPFFLDDWLWTTQRPTIAVCDPGREGMKLGKHCHEAVYLSKCDLGDMTDEEVRRLISVF